MLLFLYLFSGLISLIKKSGGIKAFADIAAKYIKSERGVFFLLWALIPVTFIDYGFRIVGAGFIKVLKQETTAYCQHCSMANGGIGANWLSKENAVKNPYYGSQILSCGKTVESID